MPIFTMSDLFYMCSFSFGNFTYLYRCRIVDQYCCDHTCCFNQQTTDSPQIFASWYFWSLILVVLIVFGCIVISFALSSFKRRVDIESWGVFAGTAFSTLATTMIGKQGIIEPRLYYHPAKDQQQQASSGGGGSSGSIPVWNSLSRGRGNSIVADANAAAAAGGENSSAVLPTVSGAVKNTELLQEGALAITITPAASSSTLSAAGSSDWVELQLNPLYPAYRSSWPGNAAEQRIAASTQIFFPPGFINS